MVTIVPPGIEMIQPDLVVVVVVVFLGGHGKEGGVGGVFVIASAFKS